MKETNVLVLLTVGAHGKFVSGAKVLADVPSISQPRTVYRELYENKDRLKTGGEAVVNKTEIQSFGRVFF